ncbi:MAG: acyl-CoA dehydratase activase [Candidatus Vogelbacteria bacterium]
MIQIGLPRIGVYSTLFATSIKGSLKELGVDNVEFRIAPPATRQSINRGSQLMDENMCLPAKMVLADILELIERGIKVVLEWDNCGECRQKTYCLVHQSTLRQLGIEAEIIVVQPGNMAKWLLKFAPHLSKRKQRKIARDLLRTLWASDLKLFEKQKNPPKGKPWIGICGEIYTVLEPAANLGLIARLEEQGAFVHNALPISQFMFEDLLNGRKRATWATRFAYLEMFPEIREWCIKRMARPDVDHRLFRQAEVATEKYFPEHTLGGHGKQSITWAIYYALAGYDGVVHILPFPCMPEATVTVLLDEVSKDYGIPINHLVFDQQFGEQNLITRAEALVNLLRFRQDGLEKILATRCPGYWLGLDVGSTSTKAVLLNGETLEIVDYEYQFTNREPIKAIKRVVNGIIARHPDKKIVGGATTGSGRRLAKALLDAPLAIDEISCQVMGCMLVDPSVRTIMEIGGQDSKVVILDQFGVPAWFNMNSICSAGTGGFLSSAAREFGIPIEGLGACAQSAECSVTITGRCGVFAESDIVSKQHAGYAVNSIVKGMCQALVQNYLSNVGRSKKLEGPIMFTGAVALNEGVVDAFSEIIGQEIRVHPHQRISGALGAAFMALTRQAVGGFESCRPETQFGSHTFNCHDCSNKCEISLVHRDDCVVCALGSRCGKHEKLAGANLDAVKIKIRQPD